MIDVNINRNVKRVESILGRAPRPVVAKHVKSFRYWMFQKQLDCTSKKKIICGYGPIWVIHWIGLRENLQETMVFTIKYRAFL